MGFETTLGILAICGLIRFFRDLYIIKEKFFEHSEEKEKQLGDSKHIK